MEGIFQSVRRHVARQHVSMCQCKTMSAPKTMSGAFHVRVFFLSFLSETRPSVNQTKNLLMFITIPPSFYPGPVCRPVLWVGDETEEEKQ